MRHAIVVTVWILALVSIAGLATLNLPHIRMTNSSMLRDYASLIADQIPEGKTVVLSDDRARELVLRSTLVQRGDRPDAILLNTEALVWPQYHKMLAKKHPARWPVDPPTNMQAQVLGGRLVNLMLQFSKTKSNQVCYAHPSFGYYFEFFTVQPKGILGLLAPYEKGQLLPEPLSEAAMKLNERFWDTSAQRLLATVEKGITLGKPTGPSDTRNPLIRKLHLQDETNPTARLIGIWLSRSLNSYGVDLQRAGFVEQATGRFEQAVRFNADNVAAGVNLKFNADLLADQPSSVQITRSVEDEFGRYRGWEEMINVNGLFDEPRFTWALAEIFQKAQLRRQSLREFDRVRQLLTNSVAPQVRCARLAGMLGDPDTALTVVEEVRGDPERFELTHTDQSELLFLEAAAYLAKQEPDKTVRVLETAIAEHPQDTNLVTATLELYMKAELLTNAIGLISRELLTRPDDVNLLVNKGFVLLRLTNRVSAVEVLSRALELQSNNVPARLNRAIANLQLDQLDAAQGDYELLVLQFPNAHPIYYGLGEIAFKRGDTNQAIYNYRLYLSNAPTNTAEAREVRQRLKTLDGSTP